MQLLGRLGDGTPARVRLAGDRIAAVQPAGDAHLDDTGSRAADALPWLLPGLVDLQVNGYAGIDMNGEDVCADTVHALVRAEWRRGVTTVLPTIVTGPPDRMLAAIRAVAEARAADPLTWHSAAGIHLEGPYLSPEDGPRGAHERDHIRPPDPGELARWREAAGDARLLVTLAPETPGAIDYIREATRVGVTVAIGHTAASPEDIHAAAAAGARLSTHLGNGTHQVLPRHPNHIWAQLADTRLAATFVADGHHLPVDAFLAMARATGSASCVLVSDSVALAGCSPGRYSTPVGGDVTLHTDGRLTLTGSSSLAGSTADQAGCLAWAVHEAGLDLATAASMASCNPARLLGLDQRGAIEPGRRADLTLLSPDLRHVRTTVVNGELVHDDHADDDTAAGTGDNSPPPYRPHRGRDRA
ncbi:N-acetylglucosamine-6-phosphate deacetylase [Actinobacteria bacterium YIM 96077]|uniref:N-acetylglucosamine-6-phosphate deacetylase n=1 Tax=Phytoactinopolyspora halophila TaxID=1981511 RepID=A0A329QCB2_9ACTN|nr:amidohydrolase family protein [Phytoactinopolyspora halophila]AYY14000.1 N-acetylglucosamine-6-phosphate deacetylase [Actinobacteria bacterium YIM 96077]RAW10023.1 N-acetylglucosamine-6-phosphate deacetylase [Phytoactinopolyspora halophila]